MTDIEFSMAPRMHNVDRSVGSLLEIEEILGDVKDSGSPEGSIEKLDVEKESSNGVEFFCKNKFKRPSGPRTNYMRTISESSVLASARNINTNKNSRKSRTGFGRGLPKKGGAGGKGTWGKLGSEVFEEDDTGALDPNDPNYDEQLEANIKLNVTLLAPPSEPLSDIDLVTRVNNLLLEYLEHGDTYDMVLSLKEQPFEPGQHSLVVVAAVETAMDHKASHREFVSVLLADLYGEVLSEEDYEDGYDKLIRNLDELVIDTPSAATVLGNFIARSVADDCIPPRFIKSYIGQLESATGAVCLARAQALLSMPHGLVRLDAVWGVGGPCRPVKTLVKKMDLLLREFLSSSDVTEAQRCLIELEVPHFHHQLVYQALIQVLESHKDHDRTEALVVRLLATLAEAWIVTGSQMQQGVLRVFENMAQIAIDAPLAYTLLEDVVAACLKEGLIPEEVAAQRPTRNRRRVVSEGGEEA